MIGEWHEAKGRDLPRQMEPVTVRLRNGHKVTAMRLGHYWVTPEQTILGNVIAWRRFREEAQCNMQ